MIDDLIPFLIFIGVALINLIKTAIERGGAKLAPPSNTKKDNSSPKRPISTFEDFIDEISEQFSNDEKIDNQYQQDIISEDIHENENLSPVPTIKIEEKEEIIIENIQKEALGAAIKSIPNALLGAKTIKTPAIPMLPNTKKGNLIFPLKIDKRSDIIADDVGPGPAPSPCKTLSPIGDPFKITAFITPLTFPI